MEELVGFFLFQIQLGCPHPDHAFESRVFLHHPALLHYKNQHNSTDYEYCNQHPERRHLVDERFLHKKDRLRLCRVKSVPVDCVDEEVVFSRTKVCV